MGLNFSVMHWKAKQLDASFVSAGMESRLITVENGSTIHCWVPKNFKAQSTSSEKPVLVLIHGFGASATWQWTAQVKPLFPHFALIMPDLLFFGKSTTDSSQRTEAFQAECIWEALKALGVKKFSVVGSSYGGFVAYRLAVDHPDAVEKVVLSNSDVLLSYEENNALIERAAAKDTVDMLLPTTKAGVISGTNLAFRRPPPLNFIPMFILNDYIKFMYLDRRAEKEELLRGIVTGTKDAPPLPHLNKDVLIMWGDSDKIFLPASAHKVKNFLGDKAELVILKDAGHVSQLEQSTNYNKKLIEFLTANKI